MPVIGSGYDSYETMPERGVNPSLQARQDASQATQVREYNPLLQVPGYILGGTVDLADTVASSIPYLSRKAGMERGDINHAVLRSLDSPGLNRWYQDNKTGLEVASGIAGVVAADFVVRKLTGPATAFMGAMRKVPYLRNIAILDEQAAEATRVVNQLTKVGVQRGISGTELARTEAAINLKTFDSASGGFITTTKTVERAAALRKAKLYSFAKGARDAAAVEAVMGMTLNQNGFLYDDSAAYNVAFVGLGIGAGGLVEGLNTAYRIRRYANSDYIKRAGQAALDPARVEEGRLGWSAGIGSSQKGGLDAGDWLAGSITDRISDYRINANRLTESKIAANEVDNPKALMENRSRLAAQWDQKALEETNKVTMKGISTDGRTRFNQNTAGHWDQVNYMLRRDPTTLQNAEMVGAIPSSMHPRDLVDAHFDRIAERMDQAQKGMDELIAKSAKSGKQLTRAQQKEFDKYRELMLRLEYEQSLTPQVAIDGEWMPLSEADSLHGWEEPKILANTHTGPEGESRILLETKSEAPGGGVTLDSNLTLTLPGKKTLDTADHFDMLRSYRLANDLIDRSTRLKNTARIALPDNASWFQLDIAEEMLRRKANVEIQWPKSMTRESAQIESMAQKVKALRKANLEHLAETKRLADKGVSYAGRMSALRVRYNLPRMSAFERGVMGTDESPIDMLMRGLADKSDAEIRGMTLPEIKKAIADFKRIGDMSEVTKADTSSLYGTSFRYMMDESGTKVFKPIVAFKRPFRFDEWNLDSLAERMGARKMRTLGALTDDEAGEFTRILAESIVGGEDFKLVSQPDRLNDLMIQGSLLGTMPGSASGDLSRSIKTVEHIARDTPEILAAQRLQDTVSRISRDRMQSAIETAFGDSLKLLRNGKNDSSKLLLDQFHSFRSGWDLEAKAVKQADGFWAFKLGDTEANRTRFELTYGRKMGEGELLKSVDGRLIVLDDLAFQVQTAFNQVTQQIVNEKNTLLKAMARSPIKSQNHFVPSPNVKGKYIGFVMGPDNKVVPGYTIREDTEAGFNAARAALYDRMQELPGGGMGYVFRTQDDIRRFADIWDRAEMDMLNPNITAIQPNKSAKGALVGREVQTDAFENSLRYLQDQFLQQGHDVMRTLLKEQIDSASARATIANTAFRRGSQEIKGRSIHDYYLEALLGKNKLNHPASMTGAIYRNVETRLDRLLADASVQASTIWDATRSYLSQTWRFLDKSEGVKRDFDLLVDRLGPHMPFKTASEMAARKYAGVDPLTVNKIASTMNKISASLMLRIMEVGQPIMNLSGVVNAMPAVIRHLQPLAGETVEQHAARVGYAATIFKHGDGANIAIPDMVKIGRRAFQRAWNRSSHADFDYMVKRGYLHQEVAEFQRQFGAIETPSQWKQWARKATDHLSILSDRSEDFSRSWGHMIGLEIADILKLEGRETRHAFAHDIANKMIANYNPANRPEVFQGGIGAPLGLFQSFIQNYYQRLFRYIETKDARAFATQYAVQGSMFGITGLSGYKEAMNAVEWLSGEDQHPAGALLSHGLLGQIPALFGAPGVDLASRGDTSVRIPGVGTQQLPGMAVAGRIWNGINAGMSLFSEANPTLTHTQIAEVLSNMVVNRPLSGMLEQFGANGIDTDNYGQVVSETKNLAEAAYRVIGLRSRRQSAELEAFYADKDAMEHKAALDDQLRASTRSAMRQGEFEKLPQIFETYLRNGGQASHFRRWMKQNYEAATKSRATRQLDKLLKNPANFERAQRMMDMGVSIDGSELYSDQDLQALMGQTDDLLTQYYNQQAQNDAPMDMGGEGY